eukprot:g4538.t1
MQQVQHGAGAAGGGTLPNTAFESWQFGAKLAEGSAGDPLLPGAATAAGAGGSARGARAEAADDQLSTALELVGVRPRAVAEMLVAQLRADSRDAARRVQRARDAARTGGSAKRPAPRIRLRAGAGAGAGVGAGASAGSGARPGGGEAGRPPGYEIVLGKKGRGRAGARLPVHAEHLHKLRQLFDMWGGTGGGGGSGGGGCGGGFADPAFADAAYCVLARHEGLQGGGFQAALNEEAFDVLLERFGVGFECFASPLNCRYAAFCSAFLDTDFRFGSVGSFFDFDPSGVGGAFEANPPFVPEIIDAMAARMEQLLRAAETRAPAPVPLCFIVVIPAWTKQAAWRRLRDCPFLRRHVRLKQAAHGFTEGKQWARKTRWRVASFDTSVFFLQNSAAARRWPATDEAVQALRIAFASKQESATAARPRAAEQARPPRVLPQARELGPARKKLRVGESEKKRKGKNKNKNKNTNESKSRSKDKNKIHMKNKERPKKQQQR